MCESPGHESKVARAAKHLPTEMTPDACGDAIQGAINNGTLEGTVEALAKPVRGLCRWLTRVCVCIEKHRQAHDGRLTALEVAVQPYCTDAWQGKLKEFEKRVGKLQNWMNGEESGSRSHAKALRELMLSGIRAREKLEANTPNNDRVDMLDCKDKQLEAMILNLGKRVDAHIRGDVDTPYGTIRGPGPLLHEKHPHDPGGHIRLSQEQSERIISGKATHDEILKEIEEIEKAQKAVDGILDSQVMRETCPDLPMGVERKRPRFCSQCGEAV